MKKPEMKDFGLTQSDFDTYKKQLAIYREREQAHIEAVNHGLKVTMIVVAVIAVVVFFILLIANIEFVHAVISLMAGGIIDGFLGVEINAYYAHTHEWEYKNTVLYDVIVNGDLERKIDAYNSALQHYEQEAKRKAKEFWNGLSGRQFEYEISKLYERLGYIATVTKASGDGGVDVILEKDNKIIAVQCKHHKGAVGPNDVRALMGVVVAQGYDYGIFVSLNGFTQTVHREIQEGAVRIDLISLAGILDMAKVTSFIDDTPNATDETTTTISQEESKTVVASKQEKESVLESTKPITKYTPVIVGSAVNYVDCSQEQAIFYNMFQEALNLNGNPFRFAARGGYGTFNKRGANSNLCLGFDLWLRKGLFRVNIYIRDDSETHYFDRLIKQKEEIEAKLGFTPMWTPTGVKQPNTRRIETHIPFTPYDTEDYERFFDELLPIVMKYLEVFSEYFPECFASDR